MGSQIENGNGVACAEEQQNKKRRIDLRNSAEPNHQDEAVVGLGYTPMIKVEGTWEVDEALKQVPGVSKAPEEGTDSPIAFFHILERLKTSKREGWRRFGITRGESIADHMYRMSLISMFAPAELAPKLDIAKCMKMSLIHDMAELLVGDITPVDGVAKPEKSRRELSTMEFLTKNLLRGVKTGTTGEDVLAIWQEYEDSKTLDSHFVHDVDKLELLLQMSEYERRSDCAIDLGDFAHVATKITLPEMRKWADEILAEREAVWGDRAHTRGDKGEEGGITTKQIEQSAEYYNRD